MDDIYELNGITFIWNSKKSKINKHKHEVTFEQAAEAFFDPFLRIIDASSQEEIRNAVIGMDSHWNILFVVHMNVEDERIRLISARKATRREKVAYEI